MSTFINLTYEEKELNKIEQLANEFLKDQSSDDYPFYVKEVGLSRADQRLNAKQSNNIKITNQDRRNNKIIKDYEDFVQLIKHRDDRICKKTVIELRQDQTSVKNRHTIHFKHVTENSEDIQYDLLSFEDEEQVEALLMFPLSSNLGTWKGCMHSVIKQYLTPTDVLKLTWEGYTQEEISEKLGISQPAVSLSIRRSVKQIIKAYKASKLDWAYTYKIKGKYKKCNKCSEVKLYFDFRIRTNGNLYNTCLECERISKVPKTAYKIA